MTDHPGFAIPADAPIRLARPVRDLAATERFWLQGVGLTVLWRVDDPPAGEHRLTMAGIPGALWHLELVDDPAAAEASSPGGEDLLVIYLGRPVEESWLRRIQKVGGRRTTALNPYWDRWGITLLDPDGYRLVLCHRTWGSAEASGSSALASRTAPAGAGSAEVV